MQANHIPLAVPLHYLDKQNIFYNKEALPLFGRASLLYIKPKKITKVIVANVQRGVYRATHINQLLFLGV